MKIPPINAAPPDPSPADSQTQSFFGQMRAFVRRNWNWFLAAGLAFLLLQDFFGTHGVLAMHHSLKEASHEQQEVNQLNEQNRQLQERVKSLKSDPEAIERIAREQMGLARPGEYIFKIPPASKNAPTAPPDGDTAGTAKKH